MTQPSSTLADEARALVADTNAQAGHDPVRVGILTPLSPTGDPTAGLIVVRGACLGAEYVRERGGIAGRGIELVLQDDQETAGTEPMWRSAVGGMARLAVVDRVVAVLGQWHLRTTPFVAETAGRLGVPIFIENGHSTVTATGNRCVFRTYYTVAERSRMMADFMELQGIRRVAMLSADTVFGLSMADAMDAECRARGIDVLHRQFPQDETEDLREPLQEIVAWGPHLFVNNGVIRTNYLIIEQGAEVGLLPGTPMMVTFGFPLRAADYWRQAGHAGTGVVWPATHFRPSWDGLTAIGKWFVARYRDRHASFPPDTAMSAFTDVTIVAEALRGAAEVSCSALLDALESRSFPTWRGDVTFGKRDGHLHHDAPDICLMQYRRFGDDVDDAAIVHPPGVRTGEYLPPDLVAAPAPVPT